MMNEYFSAFFRLGSLAAATTTDAIASERHHAHGIDHSSPAVTVVDYHRGVHPGLCRERGRSGACDHLARLRDFDGRRIFVRGRARIRTTSAPAAGRANPREVLFDVDEAG